MTREERFVNELIRYIFAYPDDDYMTMECLCRKLHKHELIAKVNSYWQPLDKPNNSTISKIEQVDKPKKRSE